MTAVATPPTGSPAITTAKPHAPDVPAIRSARREPPAAGATPAAPAPSAPHWTADAPDAPDAAPAGEIPDARDPFDAEWARAMERALLAPMARYWFRTRLVGADRLPTAGPAILASNHSGNAFPYDAIMLDALLWRRDGMSARRKLRTVYEHQLSLAWWMRPFGLPDFWRRGGGVDMTFDNFDRLLARGDRVLYYPEGVPGIGKGFDRRYQLQPFKTSFLLLAARHGAPVVPVYTVNAEFVHPCGYTWTPLDTLMRRVFGVPFLPLPIGLLACVWPWIWWVAFPAQLTYVVGEPLDVAGALAAEGVTDLAQPDRAALTRAGERLRVHIQRELDAAVAKHGKHAFDLPSLGRALREARDAGWSALARATPLGWPVTWNRHERDRHRAPARSRLHAIVRDLDLAAFYLPFGWPLLSLARRLRRPPCGVRGLGRAARRAYGGEYLWRLAERPLPERGRARGSA